MNRYLCKHCGQIVKRDSDKQWIKSWCVETNKEVRLYKIKKKKI